MLVLAFAILLALIFVTAFRNGPEGSVRRDAASPPPEPRAPDVVDVPPATLSGDTIMPHLGNATVKAELGRSAWRLLHTMMARFPDAPTADEKAALQSFLHLFVRLYPCGDCAEHFRHVIDKYPPQVSSRSAAAAWACHVHNVVNERLHKAQFDCAQIGDFYDCGCADDEKDARRGAGHSPADKPEMARPDKEKLQGANGRGFNVDLLTGDTPLRLEKEGYVRPASQVSVPSQAPS